MAGLQAQTRRQYVSASCSAGGTRQEYVCTTATPQAMYIVGRYSYVLDRGRVVRCLIRTCNSLEDQGLDQYSYLPARAAYTKFPMPGPITNAIYALEFTNYTSTLLPYCT